MSFSAEGGGASRINGDQAERLTPAPRPPPRPLTWGVPEMSVPSVPEPKYPDLGLTLKQLAAVEVARLEAQVKDHNRKIESLCGHADAERKLLHVAQARLRALRSYLDPSPEEIDF